MSHPKTVAENMQDELGASLSQKGGGISKRQELTVVKTGILTLKKLTGIKAGAIQATK